MEHEIVVLGVFFAKFSRTPDILKHLLCTGDRLLVEARRPYNTVWDISLNVFEPQPRGQYLLGQALQKVRGKRKQQPSGLSAIVP